jgi:hypothetical protein
MNVACTECLYKVFVRHKFLLDLHWPSVKRLPLSFFACGIAVKGRADLLHHVAITTERSLRNAL